MAANGTALDAGQAALVRQNVHLRRPAASGPGRGRQDHRNACPHLAWTQDGGNVIGLAPSAAAVAALGEQTGISTDTLANWPGPSNTANCPDWAARIGRTTLVIIDEGRNG